MSASISNFNCDKLCYINLTTKLTVFSKFVILNLNCVLISVDKRIFFLKDKKQIKKEKRKKKKNYRGGHVIAQVTLETA